MEGNITSDRGFQSDLLSSLQLENNIMIQQKLEELSLQKNTIVEQLFAPSEAAD
jgi:hypothetical protein